MFSSGQYTFAGFFIIVFLVAMIYSYRKDIRLHRKYYNKNYWVLLGFILFLGILFFIKLYHK